MVYNRLLACKETDASRPAAVALSQSMQALSLQRVNLASWNANHGNSSSFRSHKDTRKTTPEFIVRHMACRTILNPLQYTITRTCLPYTNRLQEAAKFLPNKHRHPRSSNARIPRLTRRLAPYERYQSLIVHSQHEALPGTYRMAKERRPGVGSGDIMDIMCETIPNSGARLTLRLYALA